MMTTMISWAAAREIAMKMGTVLVISFATNVTTTTKSPVAKTTEKVERIKTTASGRATRMTTTMTMTTMTMTMTTAAAAAAENVWRWTAVGAFYEYCNLCFNVMPTVHLSRIVVMDKPFSHRMSHSNPYWFDDTIPTTPQMKMMNGKTSEIVRVIALKSGNARTAPPPASGIVDLLPSKNGREMAASSVRRHVQTPSTCLTG